MSGVSVVRYLLASAGAVAAVVPTSRIMAGDLAIGNDLPAIVVTQISGVPFNFIRTRSTQVNTDRIQVSALAHDYPTVKQLMGLIVDACPSQRGTVNGINVIDLLPDSVGPDLFEPITNLYSQSRDFLVRWTG